MEKSKKKAIVIGGTSGLGRAVAKKLLLENYKVGITGRREALLTSFQQKDTDNIAISCFDCTASNAIEKLEKLVLDLDGVDVFVFCSGIGDLNESLTYEIENSTNQLNVVAFAKLVGWAYRYFEKQNEGHIVAISSVAGLRGLKLCPAYNASKAYQINYLEGLMQKANTTNITITDIRPGFVDTAMAKGENLFWVASPKKAAQQIVNKIQRKANVTYVSKRWWLIAFALKMIPRSLYKRF